MPVTAPERIELAPGLEISRIVTGLWQVADMERDGRTLDLDAAAADMARYAEAGFDTFDMADHYGSAEDIAGRFNRLVAAGRVKTIGSAGPGAFTKWCPTPGEMDAATVRAAVERSLRRMQTPKIDLLQLHWWMFEHPAYLDAMRELASLQAEGLIRHLGVTNFDTDHLRVLVRQGISHRLQPGLLLAARPPRGGGDDAHSAWLNGIKLLAYGTLAGGLLGEKWLGKPEPAAADIADWSMQKYKRFVDRIGGWEVLQDLLLALQTVARKHGVSIANVAARWVLDQPAVGAIIIGARLGEREHRADNLRIFAFEFDEDDRAVIDAALAKTTRIPGDCGQEYRRPPYLTASGDLSHHLQSFPSVFQATPLPGRPERLQNRQRQRLGRHRRLQPRRPHWQAHPGQRHDGHARQRRGGLPRRSARTGGLYPRQDLGEHPGAGRRARRRRAHPYLSP